MMAAAPTTCAPAARATSIVSRVEPPVVTTSSTTRTRSPASNEKPRRSVSVPSWRSAKMARTPSARATSWPMTMPPSAGDRTTAASELADHGGNGRPAGLGFARVLQDEGALEIPGAVQSGREPEMPFEQRPDPAKSIENAFSSGSRHVAEYTFCNSPNEREHPSQSDRPTTPSPLILELGINAYTSCDSLGS